MYGAHFSPKSNKNFQEAFVLLKKEHDLTLEYLLNKGLTDKEIVFSGVGIDKKFDRRYNEIDFHWIYLETTCSRVESKVIGEIESTSCEVTELIRLGVEFQSSAPQYYLHQTFVAQVCHAERNL
ncbi:MAG: hypothetical protein ABI045_02730 [Flavobacteriales bacterium]